MFKLPTLSTLGVFIYASVATAQQLVPSSQTETATPAPANAVSESGKSNPDQRDSSPQVRADFKPLLEKYSRLHDLPVSLIHRVIMRESKYRANARNGPYYGLMQITVPTARGMGFHGAPKDLLNAETNLKYATPYLSNAWRLSNGNERRAVQLYASGYYYVAKARHMLPMMRTANSQPAHPEPQQPVMAYDVNNPPEPSFFEQLFRPH